MRKILLFLWPLNQLLNLGLFNINMRGPNIDVAFSPQKNFKQLQLHQTLIFFSEFQHMQDHSVLGKGMFGIFQKYWF